MRKVKLWLALMVILVATAARAQSNLTVTAAEYFFDSDPGYGQATVIHNVVEGWQIIDIPTSSLSAGAHTFCLRSLGSNGVWSSTMTKPIYVMHTGSNTSRVEYFFDNDPGYGMGNVLIVSGSQDVTIDIDTKVITPGAHMLYLRTQDTNGNWSSVMAHPLYVFSVLPVAALEYYIDDNDPGEGLAISVPVATATAATTSFDIDTSVLSPGEHTLNIRAMGIDSVWTGISSRSFIVEGVAEPEHYAVLTDNTDVLEESITGITYGKTLTFYYDTEKQARGGMDIGPFESHQGIIEGREWNDQVELITRVVFDYSFANDTTLTSTAYWFHDCKNLTSIVDIGNLKTDNVTNMINMFDGCSSLMSLDVSGFNTANVTNMMNMFYGCSGLTSLDVTNFNTTEVGSMSCMFEGCSGLTSLDVNGFKTSNATDMTAMFMNCSGLTSLDVSGFSTANVTNVRYMFSGCSSLTSLNLSNFNTVNVTDMDSMFSGCSGLTSLDVSNFNTANVTVMGFMFSGCSGLTSLDVSNFNTTNVWTLNSLFSGCSSLTNLDVSGFKTDNVRYMSYMFKGCSSLTTIYAGEGWSTEKVTESTEMFSGCTNLVGGQGTTYDVDHIDAAYAHIDGGTSNPGYFTDKNATPVIAEAYAVLSDDNTVLTFYYDGQKSARNGLDLGPFSYPDYQSWSGQSRKITNVVFDASFADYAELSNTSYWFRNCANLTTITGIENLNTSNVEDMSSMFDGCAKLTGLDVSHFNTSKVTSFWGTFFGCRSLTSLDLSGFSTENVEYVNYMFDGCAGLTSLDLSSFSTPQLKYMYNMFDGCSNLMTIDMRNFTTARVTSMDDLFAGCTSLVAIHAGGANIPDSLYAGIGNPNLLVYVNDASVAPTSIQNVVVNGVAKEIVLTDEVGIYGNNNFFVPQSFTAEKVSYTRNFTQHTQPNVSRGWESISLPFNVQNIVHETKGELSPFGSTAEGKKFWLRRLADNGLTRASQIEANVPYVISMPNSTEYTDLYNLSGRVTFSSQYTTVPATTQQVLALADSSIVMMPTTLRVNRSSSVWAINVGEVRGQYLEGSVFERDYREVRPFEAYTVHRSNGPAPRFVPIVEMDSDATGIEDVRCKMSDGRGDQWYDLKGSKLQQKPTQKGVYILNGTKVVIK